VKFSTFLFFILGGSGVAAVALGLDLSTAEPEQPIAETSSAAAECVRLARNRPDYFDEDRVRRARTRWAEVCERARIEQPDNPRVLYSLAAALPAAEERTVDLLREAAAKGDLNALRDIYETFKSFGRSASSLPQPITRAEAEASLRKASDMGDREAIHILTVLLDRGATVKRNPAEARVWAERLHANPPPDVSRSVTGVLLGRLLATSPQSAERSRGLALLEELARTGQYGARSELANAIRAEDPVRARGLYEATLKSDPGGAVPPLVDMLLKGEGGPADPARALGLLSRVTASDPAGIRATLGRILLEGRLLSRDVRRAVDLIMSLAQWDQGAQLEVMGILAEHPEIKVEHPDSFLERGIEGAELEEPGYVAALSRLKLSQHPQFRDVPGGCALVRKPGHYPVLGEISDC
jgi:TPR repeat protein